MPEPAEPVVADEPVAPTISAERVREAILALEGTVIEDLNIPLPGDLRDIAKAAALVSGVVEDRIPDTKAAASALGPAFRRAARDGVCVRVDGAFRESARPEAHRKPLPVWRSLTVHQASLL